MNIGITLMVVGMVTVFSVLLIIIALSNLLINIVNKVAPEEQEKAKAVQTSRPVSPEVMEIIRQAVSKITNGKGRVADVVKA